MVRVDWLLQASFSRSIVYNRSAVSVNSSESQNPASQQLRQFTKSELGTSENRCPISVDGESCPRCTGTGQELKKAISLLEKALAPLGIEVEFEEVELMPQEFMKNPMRSNEVWVNGDITNSRTCPKSDGVTRKPA